MEEFTIKKKEELDPQEKSFRRRKDIIKNVIIVFLVVMLLLTFFSNTIQNYSLPKVAVQYIESGTITTVIRGEGVVESGDPYNVMVKYSKTVGSINAKVGQEVKEGDLLLTLQSEDSEELTAAKKVLEDAKKAYNDALLDPEVDAAVISSSQGTIDINGFRNKISALQTAITLAEKTVAEKQKTVDDLTNQISITTGNTVSEAEKTNVAVLLKASDNAKDALDEATASVTSAQSALDSANAALSAAQSEKALAQATLDDAIAEFNRLGSEKTAHDAALTAYAANGNSLTGLDDDTVALLTTYGFNSNYITGLITAATTAKNTAQASYDDIVANEATNIASAQADVALATSALSSAQTAKNTAQAAYNDAYTKWKNANDALIAKENNTTDSGTNLNNQLTQAKIALTDAENALKAKQDELTELVASIGSIRKLSDAQKAIDDAQKEVDKFSEVSGAAQILAPINGTILSVNVQSGKKTSTDDPVMVIQPEGQGFIMKFSLENDKAKTISVGDTAEVTNSWWYEDVQGAVTSIRPDQSDPNRKKEVTLSLTGSLTAGQTITMTVASKTANYDSIVPSSAVRGDTKGKFVLVVESKPSPLGNRYYAVRRDVEVLAEDDTKTAIQGAFADWGEYVVTTASKSIEPGAEVRLSEN